MKRASCYGALVALLCADFGSAAPPRQPTIQGPWWTVAGDPDLGAYTSPGQQPVDFARGQAADGTWQLWSCVRKTECGGNTRLFHRWEGRSLTDADWRPMGVALEASHEHGETPGGLQAPHVVKHGGGYLMFYGTWESIAIATSEDGKNFTRRLTPAGTVGLFSEGLGYNTRDPTPLLIGGRWHCYYTAYPDREGAVFCRTSSDTRDWGASRRVAFGGAAGTNAYSAECPFVVELSPGEFYLFRTQRYGVEAISRVYHSRDPLDFGVAEDAGHLLGSLAVAAPELIEHEGRWYIASLLPSLKGIRIPELEWVSQR